MERAHEGAVEAAVALSEEDVCVRKDGHTKTTYEVGYASHAFALLCPAARWHFGAVALWCIDTQAVTEG